MKCGKLVAAAVAVVGLSSSALAGELSFMKGFYRSHKVRDGLEGSEISLGSRYLDSMGGKMSWYVDAALAIKSYSAPSNESGNQTDINAGGGVRMKLTPLGERITPYIGGGAFYKSETSDIEDVQWSPTSTQWNHTSGLFYRGDLGLHIALSNEFFMDLQGNMFTSPLAGKTRSINKTPTGETKVETDDVALYADSIVENLGNVEISLGLKF